jgi:hypothetical protein
VQSSLGLSVGDPLVTPEVVLGLYFGCQTDLTLFPSDRPLEGGHVGGHSWACGVLGGQVLGELERIEDGENYLTRGFGHSHARYHYTNTRNHSPFIIMGLGVGAHACRCVLCAEVVMMWCGVGR